MELFEAIYGRQSANVVKPDPVARELVEKMLEAAVQAPNHFKVRPWRFAVFMGDGRKKLGEAMAAALKQRKPDAPAEALEKEHALAFRSPVVIVVGVDKPTGKADAIENMCAVAAANQNLLLAAHGLGLAAKWRTGLHALAPEVKVACGFEADQPIVALVYVGYPESALTPLTRPSATDRTVWVE